MASSIPAISALTAPQATAVPAAKQETSLIDYVDDASMVVGLATLAAMIPLHGKGAGQAAESAGLMSRLGRATRITPTFTKLIDSSPVASAAATQAHASWAALRAQRLALGQTGAGRAMIAAQGPLAAAGITIAGLSLGRDVSAAMNGDGDPLKIGMDLLGLAPAVGAGVRTIARGRAVASSSAAAETAAVGADKLARSARGVANVGTDAVDAASTTSAGAVLDQLDEAVDLANGVVVKSEDLLSADAIRRVGSVPVPIARPSVVNQLGSRAPRQMTALEHDLAVAEEKVANALDGTVRVAGNAGAQEVRDQLHRTLDVARDTRQQVNVLTSQAVAAERTAEHAEAARTVAAGTNNTVNLVLNSGRALDPANHDRTNGAKGAAGYGIAALRTFLGSMLRSNARGAAASAS